MNNVTNHISCLQANNHSACHDLSHPLCKWTLYLHVYTSWPVDTILFH